MSKIVFDPELMQHIKTIYGDANLNERTLKLIYNTWKVNPDWIRNAAQLKLANKLLMTPVDVPVLESIADPILEPVALETVASEIADDDLSNIASFPEAFAEARRRGLKVFNWKKTKENPSGLFGTLLNISNREQSKNKSLNTSKEVASRQSDETIYDAGTLPEVTVVVSKSSNNSQVPNSSKTSNLTTNSRVTNRENSKRVSSTDLINANIARYALNNTILGDFGIGRALLRGFQNIGENIKNFANWLNEQAATNPNNRNLRINVHNKFQQGGTMNNQEELQKAFMAYLIQDAANLGILLQSEQDLQLYAELLGEEGLRAKYQEFMLRMQGGVKARLGAKLDYYKKLKGVCPDGLEPTYLKQGGKMTKVCKACEKGKKLSKELNEVDKFKAERANKRSSKK